MFIGLNVSISGAYLNPSRINNIIYHTTDATTQPLARVTNEFPDHSKRRQIAIRKIHCRYKRKSEREKEKRICPCPYSQDHSKRKHTRKKANGSKKSLFNKPLMNRASPQCNKHMTHFGKTDLCRNFCFRKICSSQIRSLSIIT